MNKELTPFEKAGYTKDTKFRMKFGTCDIEIGDVVWLSWDDGTNSPRFTNGQYVAFLPLPWVTSFLSPLEVIQDYTETPEENQYPHIQVKLSAVGKTPTYRVHFNELYHRDLSKVEAEAIYSLLGIVLNKN